MSHLFSKKSKIKSYDASEVPLPPKVDEIIKDLESAKPDDIVFTTDVGLVDVEHVQQDISQTKFSLPRRFQRKEYIKSNIPQKLGPDSTERLPGGNQEQDNLYEKVIEYNQNVEKLTNLQESLPKVLDSLTQIHGELEEDKNRVNDTYNEAMKVYQEVNTKELSN
jgi:hypothetical protein